MHENDISQAVIGAAIEVHKILGPGLLQSIYEQALCYELELREAPCRRRVPVPVRFKDRQMDDELWLDLLVDDKVIVMVRAAENLNPFFKVLLLTQLRLADKRLGLLLNFNVMVLKQGIHRVVNGLKEGI